MRARRFWAALGSLALVAGVAAPSGAVESPSPLKVPNNMAAVGDSITIAYDIKTILRADPTYSWSTGTQSTVTSLYSRLKVKNPSLTSVNVAESGARIEHLDDQANSEKLLPDTDLVTVLLGANDACTSTESGMTAVKDFGSRADAGLNALAAKGVDQIVVASIPNVYQLWDVGRKSSSARFVWGLYKICQSMLKNPSVLTGEDHLRRLRVQDRVVAFNAELARACKDIADETLTPLTPAVPCKFDNNAVYKTTFALAEISRVDYFHPSVSGQALLARTTYPAFGFPS